MATPGLIAEAEGALKKEMASIRNAVSVLRDHQIIQLGRRIKLRETEFPSQILNTNVIAGQGVSKLPTELQDMIWGQIEPADRTVLALTSKSHAAMYQQLKDIRVLRDGDWVRRLPRPIRIDKALRLKVLVRIRDWMPTKYRLCYSCGMYIDVKKASKTSGHWGGDKKLVENGLATNKAIKQGPRCPLCVRRELVEMSKHKQTWNDYVKLGRSVTFK